MKAVVGLLILSILVQPAMRGASLSRPRQDLDPGYWQRSILPQMGIATYYAPGLMEYVVDYRMRHGQLPACEDCVGAVALLRAGDIGRKVWLQPPSGELAGPFLVVDCARLEDVPPLLDRNWAVDISYELGQTWGLTAPLDGVIVWPDPAEGNEPAPPALPAQLYIDPAEVVITAPTPRGAALPTVPLPTRLPAPRGTSALPGARYRTAPAPLTPIITTPTPPGYGAPQASPPPGPAETLVPSEPRVALGRPGQELLLAAARPALAPSPTAAATPAPTAAPPTLATAPMPVLVSPSILPTATAQTAAPVKPQGNVVQRLWWAILDLFRR